MASPDTVPGHLPAAAHPSAETFDVAVVGGGAAGLHVALEAAGEGARVALISRKPLAESASFWAQGGLAAAIAPDDSPARHAEDTLNAGRALCDPGAVEVLVREAPAAVAKLTDYGVEFDREEDGGLALALEGGHSARRIVHAGGAATGEAITRCLARCAAEQERIEVLEGTSAIALWSDGASCRGVLTDRGPIEAAATVMATGGGAALWSRTTNPWGAVAAGAALAHQAGAELAGLELCQFHPTALVAPGSPLDGRLITEAARGEGALLLDAAGRRFTDELAPRDQVTAAILDRISADGVAFVGLDLRPVSLERFPTIVAMLAEAGVDPASEPVPVSPAAHYLIGGIRTDLFGATAVSGLFAVGECAYTGLHGANRLASNSLSECFVFGSRAAHAAVELPDGPPRGSAPPAPKWRFQPPTVATRDRLWRLAGPQRTAADLSEMLDDAYPPARMIAASALLRAESRGVHRRSDFPNRDTALDGTHTVIDPSGEARLQIWG
jgi:L-aspartate oxidase